MLVKSSVWQIVNEKREILKKLVDTNWRNGEYHIAAIGERTLRTVTGSMESSENMVNLTNRYLESIHTIDLLLTSKNK